MTLPNFPTPPYVGYQFPVGNTTYECTAVPSGTASAVWKIVNQADKGLRADLDVLSSLKELKRTIGLVQTVKNYGRFTYDGTKDKSLHNVGTVIAPEALEAWDGTESDTGTLHNWVGSGTGCFVRVVESNDLYFSWFAPAGSSGLTVGYALKSINKAAYDGCSIFFDGEFKFPEVPAGVDGQITAQQYFSKNNLKLSGGKFVRETNSAEYALIFNENSGTNVTNVSFAGSSVAFEAGKGGIFFRDSTDYNVSHCFFEGLGDAWVRISRAAFTGTLPAPLTAERCSIVNNHIVLCGQLTTNNTGARHVLVANNVYENCYCALKVTARNTEIQGQILFTKNIVKGGEYGLEIQGGGNVLALDNVFDGVKRPLQVAPSITGWNVDGSLGKHLGNYNIEFARNSIKGLSDLNQALIYVTYSQSSNQGGFFKFSKNDIDLSECTNLVDVVTAFQSSTDSPTPIVDAFDLFEVNGNTIHGDVNFLLTMPVNVGNHTKVTDMVISVTDNKLRGSCTSLVNAALEITNPSGVGGEFLINGNTYVVKGAHEFSVAADNTQLKVLEFVGNNVTANGTSSVFNFWYSARVTANTTKCARNTFVYKTNATGVGVRFGVPRTDRSNESSSSLFFYENNAYAEGTYPDTNVSPRCFYFNVVTSAKKYDRLVAYDNFVDNKNGKKCRSDTSVYSTSMETMVKQLDSGEKFDVYELKRTYTDVGSGRTRNTIVRSDGSFDVFGTWQNTAEFSFTLPFILAAKDINSFSVSVVPKNQNCTFKETSRATNAVTIVFVDAGSAVYPLFDYRISGIVAQSEIYNIIGI